MYEGIKLTPSEWEKETACKILDPDGWRGNYAQDWNTPIDYEEWGIRRSMSTVEWGLSPDTDLLPAEERLQNVLKAIELRLQAERADFEEMCENGWYESVKEQRAFLNGLDIAWSLAQTEILRRG